MTDSEKSAKFRKDATRLFGGVVVALVLVLIGVVALGWWIGRWWGLGVGATIGSIAFAAGLTAAGMICALSQDSA